jgi:hypothetical protein
MPRRRLSPHDRRELRRGIGVILCLFAGIGAAGWILLVGFALSSPWDISESCRASPFVTLDRELFPPRLFCNYGDSAPRDDISVWTAELTVAFLVDAAVFTIGLGIALFPLPLRRLTLRVTRRARACNRAETHTR